MDGTVTDVQEATALSRHIDKVAVFSASWGPSDDGRHIEGPDILASMALMLGVKQVSLPAGCREVMEGRQYCLYGSVAYVACVVLAVVNLLNLSAQVISKAHKNTDHLALFDKFIKAL